MDCVTRSLQGQSQSLAEKRLLKGQVTIHVGNMKADTLKKLEVGVRVLNELLESLFSL